MSNFLTRRHLARDFKYINKNLWRKVLEPSQNVTFHGCILQEHYVSTSTGTANPPSGLHFHTAKIFMNPMSCIPMASRKYCEGSKSCIQRDRHFDLQRIHLSTSSSLANNGSHIAENSFKFHSSDSNYDSDGSAMKSEVAIFAEKLQNCESAEEVLILAESTMHTKPHHMEYFPLLFSTYQEQVYKTLTFPWLLPDRHLKKVQLQYNFLVNKVIKPYTTDFRFENLISLTEEHVGDISYSDCLQILHSLHYLFITTANSSLARKICDVCSANMDKFDLHQLANLSECVAVFPYDTVLIGKIANTAKQWLLTHASHDVDLRDLCQVFNNTKYLLSAEMFNLGVDTIINKLKTHPSRITLDMISKISLFSHISNNTCENDLLFGLQDIPNERFSVEISERDLTIEVCSDIEKNTFVCPILGKLEQFCISEIPKLTAMSVTDVMRYSALLNKISKHVLPSSATLFVQHVKQSDNFLLLQLMRSHSGLNFRNMPCEMELLDAFHQRFVQIFTSLSYSDQSQLLWQNGGHFGNHLFLLMCKLRASGLRLNPSVISAFDNHFLLLSPEWYIPFKKIIVSTMYAIEKLKSNILLTPIMLSTLEKLFARLDITYLMYLSKKVDLLSLQSGLSPTVKKQCQELKIKLLTAFDARLSGTNTLILHYFSSKIMPNSKKHWLRKPAGTEIYEHLVDSIPRFLKDSDMNNCLQALRILHFGVDVHQVHQKETFEKLTAVVTSSPKLLVQPGLKLVKLLAFSGCQADVNGSFTTWTQNLVTEVLRQNRLRNSTLVSLAYHLALLGIFHDALLLKIFSLDFIRALEQELTGSASKTAASVRNDLALLNRSVAIECPHLAVSWFGRRFHSYNSLQSSEAVEELIKSIGRLTGDSSYFLKSAKSPYDHHIDAVMFFDPSSGLLKCEDVQNRQSSPGIEKIALLCPQWSDFCSSSDVLIGQYQADIRQLQILGYTVILFTEKELSSMDVYNEEHLDKYVQSKINASTHFQVFKELQQ